MTLPVFSMESVTDLLLRAEQIKLSEPKEYSNLLRLIKKQKLSTSQSQHLAYLEGFGAQYLGQHDLALEKYQQALNLDGTPELKFKTIISLSNLMTVKRNSSAAFSYMFQAMSLLPQIENPELKTTLQMQALTAYRSLEFYEKTLEVSKQLIADNVQGRALCFAWFYHDLSIQKLAPSKLTMEEVKSHFDYCASINEPLLGHFVGTILIQAYLEQHDYSTAENALRESIPEVTALKFPHLIGRYHVLHAEALIGQKRYNEAIDALEKLFAASHQLDSSSPMVDGYRLRAEIAEYQNNLSDALYYHKKYSAAEQAYRDSLSEQQTAYHLAKGEIEAKNQHIDLLEKDNRLLQLAQQLAKSESQRNQLFMALLAISLFFVGYFAIKTLRSKQRYRVLAENDSLTGISNRYHFTEHVKALLDSSKKTSQIDSFLIFDLDWFKQINDQYGHLTGDWVLQTVVEHSKPFVRNLDVFGRIGGEEFALYLPACTAEQAAMLAEILRDAIAQIDCSGSGHSISITASFGVTSTDRSGYEMRHLFRDADHALYQSKHGGRNRVSLFKDAV